MEASKLSEFLEEPAGGFSSTRLVFVLWMVGLLAAYLYTSIEKKQLQAFPDGMLAVIGILCTQRTTQRFAENKDPSLIAGDPGGAPGTTRPTTPTIPTTTNN